ncbi:MAG: Flp pilus assembly protein CpaB [Kineosporiaceae bacterium]|nr:Flp pilus assembly protein CpaB [Kineosporiaceae bacterium]
MNPRQRRGLVLILVSVVIALATFVVVMRYVAGVNSQVGVRVTVYQAADAIEAYTPLTPQNLRAVEIPRRWVSNSSILELQDLVGRRVGFRVSPGTTLSSDMLVPSSSLDKQEREVAINVDPVTGVAGRVRPGDRVDIYAVFGEVPGLPKTVKVLTRGVRVVSIAGQQTVVQKTEQGTDEATVVPVTLALRPQDAMAVTYAANFATEVRLVALPTDVGVDRRGEPDSYDAGRLGGQAIPEGNP